MAWTSTTPWRDDEHLPRSRPDDDEEDVDDEDELDDEDDLDEEDEDEDEDT
ncbi:MAG: hypothetical protein Q8Q58_01815 [Candidatus Rokubacteria bacterium]|nr:hypothetical protein [Candidatus Rokubacteria bacterium]